MSDRKNDSRDAYEAMVLQETLAQLADHEGKLRALAYVKEAAAARLDRQMRDDAALSPDAHDSGLKEIQKNLNVARNARIEADEITKRAKTVIDRLDALEAQHSSSGEPVEIVPTHVDYGWDDVVQTVNEFAEKWPGIRDTPWFPLVAKLEGDVSGEDRRAFFDGIVRHPWTEAQTPAMSAVAGVVRFLLSRNATPLKD